ncbi:hypothetical protein QKU58_gp031 [Pyramimonas orientalis virus]|uniref:Uncharacterized protein n=1 Tax=Pyramimonas orientalis virus 01B TaxID=3134525 RepID=A0A7L9AYK8_9VIRU|nr:hypothetical protein QKU58_gp031 [Pyramimonas orientalis virus]QOI90300.1 hypothetical protein HWQ62_00163 [Pyramimonas orientalis virus]
MMNNLYFLNKDHSMFATYINDKCIVITSPDRSKLHGLNIALLQHKTQNNKWMNKGYKYISKGKGLDIMELAENNHYQVDTFDQSFMDVSYLDMDDPIDTKFMNQIYELSKLQIFMMYDYEYIPSIPLLTLQGVLIQPDNGEDDEMFEIAEFFEALIDL